MDRDVLVVPVCSRSEADAIKYALFVLDKSKKDGDIDYYRILGVHTYTWLEDYLEFCEKHGARRYCEEQFGYVLAKAERCPEHTKTYVVLAEVYI